MVLRGRWRVAAIAALAVGMAGSAVIAVAALAPSQGPVRRPVPQGVVYREGGALFLDGRPYAFTGLNIYNANSPGDCWYDMRDGSALDDALGQLGPGHVVRAWFTQNLAIRGHRRDWSAFDHTVSVAATHGDKVIPVLTLQGGDCGTGSGRYKTEAWYASLYRTEVEPSVLTTYRQYVADVVARYRSDPTILMWELVSEPEDMTAGPADGGVCSATAAATLRAFFADVAGLIKRTDPDHLIGSGTIGTGQCGTSGADYQALLSDSNLDACSYHDYGAPTTALPGDRWNGLAVRISQCRALDKPVYVGEGGIRTSETPDGSLATRATLLRAKVEAQAAAGVAGWLLWDWRAGNEGGSAGVGGGYEVGPGDPALAVLRDPAVFGSLHP